MRLKNSMHDDSIIGDATKDIDIILKFLYFVLFDKKIYISFHKCVVKVSH